MTLVNVSLLMNHMVDQYAREIKVIMRERAQLVKEDADYIPVICTLRSYTHNHGNISGVRNSQDER